MTIKKYLLNIAIGFDQLCNAFAGGNPDEVISSRLGRRKLKGGGKISWRQPLSKIIDWGLERIDKGHSIDSIEDEYRGG